AFVPQADISRALATLTTSEEAVSLLALPANLYLEPAVPVPYRDEAEFADGMPGAPFGIHANNLVPVSAAKNWRNRQIPGCWRRKLGIQDCRNALAADRGRLRKRLAASAPRDFSGNPPNRLSMPTQRRKSIAALGLCQIATQ